MVSKQLSTLSVVLILVMVFATGATAAPGGFRPSQFRYDHAPIASVHFFPQDMDSYNRWFRFGPWGLMTYRLWGEEFRLSFRGFNLDRRTNYTLIYYPGPESESNVVSLGSGRTNRRGNLNIRASLDICELPSTADPNYFYGAQIMLVPSASVSSEGGELLDAGSEDNLISYHAIRFINTDGCPVEEPEIPADAPPAEDPPADETGDEGDGSDDDIDYDNDPDVVHPY